MAALDASYDTAMLKSISQLSLMRWSKKTCELWQKFTPKNLNSPYSWNLNSPDTSYKFFPSQIKTTSVCNIHSTLFIPQIHFKNAGSSVRRFMLEKFTFQLRNFLNPVRKALFLIPNQYLYAISEIEIR